MKEKGECRFRKSE